ncbi:MAG: DUF5721 family protein [Eubacterium sp.]|nr:DUF5721 family protein [Eubacterium sp.]
MTALKITEVKDFMNRLLMQDTFDFFYLVRADIVRDYSVSIDGIISPQFYTEEEKEILGIKGDKFLKYGKLRDGILGHIKGKRSPLLFKLTLAMKADEALLNMKGEANTKSSIEEFLINIKFDSKGLVLTTGVSYSSFNPDKSSELLWDEYICEFLKSRDIVCENI